MRGRRTPVPVALWRSAAREHGTVKRDRSIRRGRRGALAVAAGMAAIVAAVVIVVIYGQTTSAAPSTTARHPTTMTNGGRGVTQATAAPRPPSVGLFGLHHFATTARWVNFRRGERTLPTLLIAPRVPAGTTLPAIEFAHGWNVTPRSYVRMLVAWASAGFLVIAPTSPGMASGGALTSEETAISGQIADLPAVLTQALAMKSPIVINRKAIVLAGHSDGGTSVATAAFDPHYTDHRVAAYLIFSWGTNPSDFRRIFKNKKPVFIADSYRDQFDLWPYSRELFQLARGPKVLVGIGRGDTHLPPWSVDTPFHELLWSATVSFSLWSITGSPAAHTQMLNDLRRFGFSTSLG